MDILREKKRALGQHRACGGGDSSSSSAQNTSYQFSDSRRVSSTDSHDNYSQDNRTDSRQDNRIANTTTTITATDFGAVQAGSSLGIEALKQNSTNTAALFTVADRLFQGTARSLDANAALAKDLSTSAQQSFESAADIATGNKTMLLVGVSVVGMVALMTMGNK